MIMSYPKHLDVTPIVINLTDGLTEEGDEKVIGTYTGKCVFSSKTRYVRGADGHEILLLGKAIIGCDIAPDVAKLTGKVTINGIEYKIYQSSRPYNPGSNIVHHTELELM